jgi:hypothetical protein
MFLWGIFFSLNILRHGYGVSLQSSLAAHNTILRDHQQSLLIQLYSDGIAITNPLGPKKDGHKLTMFYYQVEDLPDVIRSSLNVIQLHAICYSDSLESQESRKTIYRTLVDDLNELQRDGITVPTIDGRIYFAFTCIAADNLSANDLGGFQKNFSSGNFCRHCLISYEH